MPRIARMVLPDQKAVYHDMSRTALDGFPFKDGDLVGLGSLPALASDCKSKGSFNKLPIFFQRDK